MGLSPVFHQLSSQELILCKSRVWDPQMLMCTTGDRVQVMVLCPVQNFQARVQVWRVGLQVLTRGGLCTGVPGLRVREIPRAHRGPGRRREVEKVGLQGLLFLCKQCGQQRCSSGAEGTRVNLCLKDPPGRTLWVSTSSRGSSTLLCMWR